MSLADHVRILGRGPGRSRSLTEAEAQDAMTLILAGEEAPEAVGALLMLMRFRGETPGEVAGFAQAIRLRLPAWQGPAPGLDWPSYAAGRSRGLPWFLLSARLVAEAGVPVLLHGWNSHQAPRASVRQGLAEVGIATAASLADVAALLARDRIAYLPLEAFAPEALRLLRLREVLGLRSAINTVLRVVNPGRAPASVQGVFHPPYLALQLGASALLGQRDLCVLKGGGGEFERHPGKDTHPVGLRGGQDWTGLARAHSPEVRRLSDDDRQPGDLARLWSGALEDDFARAVVLGTAALALETTGAAAEGRSQAMAEALWQDRQRELAA